MLAAIVGSVMVLLLSLAWSVPLMLFLSVPLFNPKTIVVPVSISL